MGDAIPGVASAEDSGHYTGGRNDSRCVNSAVPGGFLDSVFATKRRRLTVRRITPWPVPEPVPARRRMGAPEGQGRRHRPKGGPREPTPNET